MWLGILVAIVAVVALTLTFILAYVVVSKTRLKKKHAGTHINSNEATTLGSSQNHNTDSFNSGLENGEDGNQTEPYGYLMNRFRTIGFFVVTVFAVLCTKLFSMQVLNSDSYVKQSSANATTSVKTPAPRGNIYDCKGNLLVKNRSCLTILADSYVANDSDTIAKLSVCLGIPRNIVKKRVQDSSSGAQSQRVVASDVSKKQAAYISEHSLAFPGVNIETRTVRDYPYGALAAHVLGYTGIASEQELSNYKDGRFMQAGDIVGKSGIEESYDSVLSGDHGERIVVSDADGNIVQIKSEIQPSQGSNVCLTINAYVQSIADKLLADTIAPNGEIGQGVGCAGSIVVMDVSNGDVIALSNFPTFKPSIFTNGISQDTWSLYNTDASYYPLMNRAIAGTYPAASTFKAFTGLAGLTYGYANKTQSWNCKGYWDGWNSGNIQRCWNLAGHGAIDFRSGIVQSCDVVFYEIGKLFFDNSATIGEVALQEEIIKYNFGKMTGVDISGEEPGRVPTPLWKKEYFKDVPTEAAWLGGDTTNMAIGQGYVLVTPIQLAMAYGAIATGKLMRPHLLKEVKNTEGVSIVTKQSEMIGIPNVSQENLNIIRDALHGVATENYAVAKSFRASGLDAAAKTGTAEVAGKSDYAWTAAYAPYTAPKYAVSCLIEEGGGGSDVATPIVAEVLAAAINASEDKLEKKIDVIAGSNGISHTEKNINSSSRAD